MTKEKILKEISVVGPSPAAIHLDRDDLLHLSLLRITSGGLRISDPRRKITVPNRLIDPNLATQIAVLEADGRIKTKAQIPKRIIAPGKSGNTVIIPHIEDETVLAAFTHIDSRTLNPLLDFVDEGLSGIRSVDIFPNFSAPGAALKGLTLNIDPGANKWWQRISRFKWPIERGITVTALPIDGMEFLTKEEESMPIVRTIARASDGVIKYIRFFYNQATEQVFMMVAAGPSDRERIGLNNELLNIHKPGKAAQLMKEVKTVLDQRRTGIVGDITDALKIQGGYEIVSNAPYITLDMGDGIACSGGVGHGITHAPFALSKDGLLIYQKGTDQIQPLGLVRSEANKPLAEFFSPTDFKAWLQGLKTEISLRDLSLGFHTEK